MEPDTTPPLRRRWPVLVVCVVALAALCTLAPTNKLRVDAGPLIDTGAGTDAAGRFSAPTIALSEQRVWQYLAGVAADAEYVSNMGEAARTGALVEMRESVMSAEAVAEQWTGTEVELDAPTGVAGNSAGLALTLTAVDLGARGDLSAGMRVAATGAVDGSGDVGPVGGVRHKLTSLAGFDVAFVPERARWDQVPEGLTVVEVRDVADAINWLCDHGADDEVCTQL